MAPFETETEIWRDEQPGTDARLHVVVRLLLGHGAQPWSDVVSADVELRAEPKSWRPETKALRQTGQGGLELHAQGPATLPAGLSVVPVIELTTSTGTQRLVLDADVVQVVD